ncbi:uncharacterized protein LOC62_05G007550 [Vanrija pseudolonga]|uniref:Uncharacterized protein n=1 Tax=Vanrija pseudolonga TaxID=143232 RepID=A0AAF1BSW9_9TREE|nr:hypothetical protein LOC62_05G007550 [Vanrija pseudolonga]
MGITSVTTTFATIRPLSASHAHSPSTPTRAPSRVSMHASVHEHAPSITTAGSSTADLGRSRSNSSLALPGSSTPLPVPKTAGEVLMCLSLYRGGGYGQYPIAVVVAYVENKFKRGKSRAGIIRKLEALEKKVPSFARSFAAVRLLYHLGPSRVVDMEWPPSFHDAKVLGDLPPHYSAEDARAYNARRVSQLSYSYAYPGPPVGSGSSSGGVSDDSRPGTAYDTVEGEGEAAKSDEGANDDNEPAKTEESAHTSRTAHSAHTVIGFSPSLAVPQIVEPEAQPKTSLDRSWTMRSVECDGGAELLPSLDAAMHTLEADTEDDEEHDSDADSLAGRLPPRSLWSTAESLISSSSEGHRAVRSKVIVLVDDSLPLTPEWSSTRDEIARAGKVAEREWGLGIDVYFMNSKRVGKNLKASDEVEELFAGLEPRGPVPKNVRIRARVREILREVLVQLERSAIKGTMRLAMVYATNSESAETVDACLENLSDSLALSVASALLGPIPVDLLEVGTLDISSGNMSLRAAQL